MRYSQKVIDHFRHPRNFGRLEDTSAVGIVGNPTCGDVMKLYLKIDKNKNEEEIIVDVKFETFGCAAAIATSSQITEMVKGKTLDQALLIKNQDIVEKLGDLPVIKIHCSVLAADALAEAIYNHWKTTGQAIPKSLEAKHKRIERHRLEEDL